MSSIAADGFPLKGNLQDMKGTGGWNWSDRVNSIILGPGCDRMEVAWHDYRQNTKKHHANFMNVFSDQQALDNYAGRGGGARGFIDKHVGTLKDGRISGKWISYNKALTGFMPDLDWMEWAGVKRGKGHQSKHNAKINGSYIDLGYIKPYDMRGEISGISTVERKMIG